MNGRGRDSSIDAGRRDIHRRMRRCRRLPLYLRMAPQKKEPFQEPVEVIAKEIEKVNAPEPPKHWTQRDMAKPTKGFLKRLFNRKTGG